MQERKYTLQVAPEDCTGCGLCVAGLPRQEQERSEAQGHQHGAAAAAARAGSRQLGLLPEDPRDDRRLLLACTR
jgi:Na+-translocating ferredoxin:NAD+ oxidoreductase RNF subunit RnfB